MVLVEKDSWIFLLAVRCLFRWLNRACVVVYIAVLVDDGFSAARAIFFNINIYCLCSG